MIVFDEKVVLGIDRKAIRKRLCLGNLALAPLVIELVDVTIFRRRMEVGCGIEIAVLIADKTKRLIKRSYHTEVEATMIELLNLVAANITDVDVARGVLRDEAGIDELLIATAVAAEAERETAAVDAFFANLDRYRSELDTLMTDHFEILNCS